MVDILGLDTRHRSCHRKSDMGHVLIERCLGITALSLFRITYRRCGVEYIRQLSRVAGTSIHSIRSFLLSSLNQEQFFGIQVLQYAWHPSKRIPQGKPKSRSFTFLSPTSNPHPRVRKNSPSPPYPLPIPLHTSISSPSTPPQPTSSISSKSAANTNINPPFPGYPAPSSQA